MFLFSIQFSFIRFQNYICLFQFQFLVMFYCLIFSLYSFIKVLYDFDIISTCQRKHLFKASDLCLHRDLSLKKITNTSYGGKNNQMNIN